MLEPTQSAALTRLLPDILAEMDTTKPSLGGTTSEDRADAGSKREGWELFRAHLIALVNEKPVVAQKSDYQQF